MIDTESIRRALGDTAYAALTDRLRAEWSARAYFWEQKQARIKAASDRIAWAHNSRLGGMRPTLMLDIADIDWLNRRYPGWEKDEEFQRDLKRHHPETFAKVDRPANKVGWTPSLNRPAPERHTPTAAPIRIVLADKRGNAEDPPNVIRHDFKTSPKSPAPGGGVVNPHVRRNAA